MRHFQRGTYAAASVARARFRRPVANKANGSRRHPTNAERPYRWSQCWHEDPPAGTVVFNGGNPIEVFTGVMWITVDRDDLAVMPYKFW
jgi:hypothetical protein